MGEMLHKDLTGQIIGVFYDVYNDLGYGFLEKVYENALAHKLRQQGLKVKQQEPVQVHYEGILIGEFYADLLVENKVMLELKTVEKLHDAHTAQLINYLKATSIEIGLVLNFGPKPRFKRQILTNDRKKWLKQ